MPHTPGPWKKVNNCTVRGPHGEPVASTKGFAWPEDVNHDANATLIEAAPDLLEALRDLTAPYSPETYDAAFRAARAAIAKAEGT